jgi:2-(1,2-epoxy-1,2-dihydrophenyl)acetyl-CoA isomerase
MSFETVVFATSAGIARLRLNRPEKLNAFTRQMHAEIAEALSIVEQDRNIRALLLTGTGRAFCAGQDLTERDTETTEAFDLGANIETYYNPLVRRLSLLPVPILCAVNGIAAGAGVSLALACDMVIACKSASFVQAFVKIGLVPDSGGTWLLANHLGQARAMGLAMTGAPIDAETAERWGLIWKAVADDTFEMESESLAQKLAQAPVKGLVAIRTAIRAAAGNSLSTQLDLERDLQRQLGLTADYREGVNAFKQRRSPDFRDR